MAFFNTEVFEFSEVLEAYEILKEPLCSDFETTVKKSFRKLAREYHPDKNPDKQDAEEKFKHLSNAYRYLEAFKDTIKEQQSEILKFQEIKLQTKAAASSACVNSENKPQAQTSQKESSEQAENLRKQQEHEEEERRKNQEQGRIPREIASLLSFCEKNPFPTSMPEAELHLHLVQSVTSSLSTEAKLVEKNIDDFIQHLYSIQRNIIEHLKRENNYIDSHVFIEDEIKNQARKVLLNKFILAIEEDIKSLNAKKSKVASYTNYLQSPYNPNTVDTLMGLHAELENINTHIASIQLSNHYNAYLGEDFELNNHLPAQQLTLNFITRVTGDFFKQASKWNDYFTELDLKNNKLFRVSGALTNWQSLRRFEMHNSPQVGFPDFIVELKNLEKLSLENNHIENVPKHIGRLRKLKELYLGGNNLNDLPFMETLSKLKILYLNDNNFSKIPKHIGALIDLQVLSFANTKDQATEESPRNNISEITNDLKRLVNLEQLNLNDNKIRFIPELVFAKWKKLKELHINENNLFTLPKNIGDLKDLKYVDASCNIVSFIPSSILKRNGQKLMLDLRNNVLHQHQLAVESVLIQMGWSNEAIKALIDAQSQCEMYPMSMDEEFCFEKDTELQMLQEQYRTFIQSKEIEQKWLMLSQYYTQMPPVEFVPQTVPVSLLLNDFLQRKQPSIDQQQFFGKDESQNLDAPYVDTFISNLVLG